MISNISSDAPNPFDNVWISSLLNSIVNPSPGLAGGSSRHPQRSPDCPDPRSQHSLPRPPPAPADREPQAKSVENRSSPPSCSLGVPALVSSASFVDRDHLRFPVLARQINHDGQNLADTATSDQPPSHRMDTPSSRLISAFSGILIDPHQIVIEYRLAPSRS